jgi:ABC-type dipeptide/oligopeptide/nickel transport system permease component
MRLAKFILKRLLFLLPQLLLISAATFFLIRLLPGDPAFRIAGPLATDESIRSITEKLGLDQPLVGQYWTYLKNLAQGDLGDSWYTAQPVLTDILDRFPATLELLTASVIIAVVVAVPIGVISAVRPGGIVDRGTVLYALLAGAMPEFLLALILILLFFTTFSIFPAPVGRIAVDVIPPDQITGLYTVDSLLTGNWRALSSSLSHLALPSLTLAFVVGGPIMKMTRSSVASVLESGFLMYGRASGLTTLTLARYALRNALPPVVTLLGFLYGYLIGGAVLIETIFGWGGLGQYAVLAINNSDYLALQGFVLVATLFSVAVYLAVDMIHFAIDPRIEY